jgi:2-hydroxy-3-oxopropionate reductase
LARKSGIDPAKMRQALLGGSAQSAVLERHGQRMLDRNFAPGFRARFHLKDMNIIMSTAREYGAVIPGSALVMEMFKSLAAAGKGDDDHSSVLRVIEGLSGLGE